MGWYNGLAFSKQRKSPGVCGNVWLLTSPFSTSTRKGNKVTMELTGQAALGKAKDRIWANLYTVNDHVNCNFYAYRSVSIYPGMHLSFEAGISVEKDTIRGQ